MKIKIENCNNIKECNLEIQEGKLNIKYGINGTGKSTISKVIKESKESDLSLFKPFKSSDDVIPTITYIDKQINKVLIYNEDYVNQYLFISQDNIHENSFEVFAKVPEYDTKIAEINEKLDKVKTIINSNEKIDELISIYNQIDKEIKINSNNKLGNSGVVKSLSNGNKIVNIPEEIKKYSPFLQSALKIKWYDWYTKGFEFYEEHCPFCTTEIKNLVKEKNLVDNLFVKTDVTHISTTSELVEKLSNFTNSKKDELLKSILNDPKKISDESKKELLEFKLEFTKIVEKLQFLKNLSYLSINKLDDVEKILNELRFDFNSIIYFNSDSMKKIFEEINNSIDAVLENIVDIKKATGILNTEIKVYIRENEYKINEFLKSVGMSYEVEITRDKIRLKYINSDIIVEPKSHLSWGEKNCFALALFLFDCLASKPELVILDDPVSSFDTNKKYGIMHYLFKGEKSLKDKTVLMFSHDIEPIINFYKKDRTIPNNVVAYCLSNHNNIVEEKIITNDKLNSVIDQCEEKAKNANSNILSRLINCRRLFELQNNYECAYDILSNLFHNNSKITKLNGKELSEKEIKSGLSSINLYIEKFDYDSFRNKFNDFEEMKRLYFDAKSNYEKIEIFRIINDYFSLNGSDNNIMKFINETYHIENSFIYQLDPYEYDCVPNYIIIACDEILKQTK